MIIRAYTEGLSPDVGQPRGETPKKKLPDKKPLEAGAEELKELINYATGLWGGPCWVKLTDGRMVPGKVLSCSLERHEVSVEHAVTFGKTGMKKMIGTFGWKIFKN